MQYNECSVIGIAYFFETLNICYCYQ